ncbi:hypothetical protein QCA50_005991 [Cerrena zonata]|uniref:Uncharacterized protein n=1 Tax=Cerrena zonata TaxID=2478898 RepID=A0AAW0GI92_9APHY
MPNLHHSKSNVGRKKRKGVSIDLRRPCFRVDVSDSPYAWLRLCKNIPFYSLQKTADKITWSASFKEVDAAYLGNESRPDSADSIYLSYAMVVVPNKKRKRN